jgi:hypothetical protein
MHLWYCSGREFSGLKDPDHATRGIRYGTDPNERPVRSEEQIGPRSVPIQEDPGVSQDVGTMRGPGEPKVEAWGRTG